MIDPGWALLRRANPGLQDGTPVGVQDFALDVWLESTWHAPGSVLLCVRGGAPLSLNFVRPEKAAVTNS